MYVELDFDDKKDEECLHPPAEVCCLATGSFAYVLLLTAIGAALGAGTLVVIYDAAFYLVEIVNHMMKQ